MERGGYTYILTNRHNTVLYIGVTSDLVIRMQQHKEMIHEGFTKKYKVTKLVYYEVFNFIEDAISCEKQLKGGSRAKKLELIILNNSDFMDLTDGLEV
jgi:putative endonuclease